MHITGEVTLFKVEYLFIPAVESATEVNQDNDQRGNDGGEEDLGIGSATHGLGMVRERSREGGKEERSSGAEEKK
jgi:hypothetical protein